MAWNDLRGPKWSPGGAWKPKVKIFTRIVVIRIDFLNVWAGLGWPQLAWADLGWPGLAWAGMSWPWLAWVGLGLLVLVLAGLAS